jgi:hypothetical protein
MERHHGPVSRGADRKQNPDCGYAHTPEPIDGEALATISGALQQKGIAMRLTKRLTFLPALLFLVACAYGQDVHYNYDRGANFAAYKTYQWVDLPGPGGAVSDQLIDQSIKRAVDEQLAQKSLTRVDKGADLTSAITPLSERKKASTCRHLVTAAALGDGAVDGEDGVALASPARRLLLLSERCL